MRKNMDTWIEPKCQGFPDFQMLRWLTRVGCRLSFFSSLNFPAPTQVEVTKFDHVRNNWLGAIRTVKEVKSNCLKKQDIDIPGQLSLLFNGIVRMIGVVLIYIYILYYSCVLLYIVIVCSYVDHSFAMLQSRFPVVWTWGCWIYLHETLGGLPMSTTQQLSSGQMVECPPKTDELSEIRFSVGKSWQIILSHPFMS